MLDTGCSIRTPTQSPPRTQGVFVRNDTTAPSVFKPVISAHVLPAIFALLGALMSHASDTDEPTFKNRLADSKSPYLLQHADNPVDWYPWGAEAFAKAEAEDKPIFLSIGYATCHWCHVMEHESFEDPEVAALMNDVFINIKVDREERPDIDQVYMSVCQMLTGGGGWPLTIVMTPDKRPFYAATYIPRESRFGRIGMTELVPRLQRVWQSDRDKITATTEHIVAGLQKIDSRPSAGTLDPGTVDEAYTQLAGRYDATHGTLEKMRLGGVYDQIGFGFHRYSTDAEWLVPHFEKMLYDQAMLTMAYTEAWLATRNPLFEQTVREVVTYVLRDMTSPDGGFYSAEDADSEGEEGLFYLWTLAEIDKILGTEDGAFAAKVWNLTTDGNYTDEVKGTRTGRNIPHLTAGHAAAARGLGMKREDFDKRLEDVRSRLFDLREARVHPLKDDKVLADWNGLMSAAIARAGRVFGEPGWVEAAEKSAAFVLREMQSRDGRLLHRYRAGDASISAFLDDCVFMTTAMLDLYDATFNPAYLKEALDLQQKTLELFWDHRNGGLFFTAADNEELLVRQKEIYDGAIPSGNSMAAENSVRLAGLTGDTEHLQGADHIFAAFSSDAKRLPSAHSQLMSALLRGAGHSFEVVIAGDPGADDTDALIATIRESYLPQASVLLVPSGTVGDAVRELAPFAEGYVQVEGRAAAYVCRNFECQLPTTDPKKLARLLEEAVSKPSP